MESKLLPVTIENPRIPEIEDPPFESEDRNLTHVNIQPETSIFRGRLLHPCLLACLPGFIIPAFFFFSPYLILKFFPDSYIEGYRIIGKYIFPVTYKQALFVAFRMACILSILNIFIREAKRRSVFLFLGEEFLTYSVGILFRKSLLLQYDDIRVLAVEQTFIEKLFGFGTIMIATAGTAGYELVIRGFGNPCEIVDFLRIKRHPGRRLEDKIREIADLASILVKIAGVDREDAR